jgi:flagellar protein FliS
MRTKAYQNYFEDEVLSADPVRLVQLLYRGAIDSIERARRCLAEGDIRGRSRAITKCHKILVELSTALDHSRGAEVSRGLAELYDYMMRRLIQANATQTDAPLAEIERLLLTLEEAWRQCPAPASTAESKSGPEHLAYASSY